jgi:hypothetical protein
MTFYLYSGLPTAACCGRNLLPHVLPPLVNLGAKDCCQANIAKGFNWLKDIAHVLDVAIKMPLTKQLPLQVLQTLLQFDAVHELLLLRVALAAACRTGSAA